MDLYDLNDLARQYRDMGHSVQEQLESLLINWDISASVEQGEINPNALPLMRPYLEAAAGVGAEDAQEALDLIDEWDREMRAA